MTDSGFSTYTDGSGGSVIIFIEVLVLVEKNSLWRQPVGVHRRLSNAIGDVIESECFKSSPQGMAKRRAPGWEVNTCCVVASQNACWAAQIAQAVSQQNKK